MSAPIDPETALRDWFAGQALAGYLAGNPEHRVGSELAAAEAYLYADAMLAARKDGAAPDLLDDALAALRPIIDRLGFAEWASPEHAEEILRGLINEYWADGRAVLAKAGGAS